MKIGKVYLVGAGPGDIGLMTLKGMDILRQADVILYDRLVNAKLLEFAPPHCEFIYCGKLPNRHVLCQEHIHAQLVAKAKEGKTVVRLKGGDPSVFGRVGEEAEELAKHGIPFEIVPGITSGIAAPLYAGIPITHREYGNSFALVTAHDKSKQGKPNLDWEALAKGIDTIAFYMGVANLPFICEKLMEYGKSPETPVILIQWGTMGRQKTLEGTLATIAQKAASVSFSNPAITLVGEIVSIRAKIKWFEKKRLFGRQILLAREGVEENRLAKELMNEGADVIEFPKWKIVPREVDATILANIATYKKMLFTSRESVSFFFHSLFAHGVDIRSVQAELFSSSYEAKDALQERGLLAKPTEFLVEDEKLLIVGDDSLFHQAFSYSDYDVCITHQKQVDEKFFPILTRMLENVQLDTLVFPSCASVDCFMEAKEKMGETGQRWLERLHLVCIGDDTRIRAEAYGLKARYVQQQSELIEYLAYTGTE